MFRYFCIIASFYLLCDNLSSPTNEKFYHIRMAGKYLGLIACDSLEQQLLQANCNQSNISNCNRRFDYEFVTSFSLFETYNVQKEISNDLK